MGSDLEGIRAFVGALVSANFGDALLSLFRVLTRRSRYWDVEWDTSDSSSAELELS